jgi:hypothetical protein
MVSVALVLLVVLGLGLAGLIGLGLVLGRELRSRRVELVVDAGLVAAQRGFERYFAGLTPCDLAARGSRTGAAAREAYLSAVMREGHPKAEVYRTKMEEAARLRPLPGPMRVVVLDDAAASVESGWPHTHGHLICMPASYLESASLDRLARTLVHERTHVCQRMDPGRCQAPGAGERERRIAVGAFDAMFPDLAARRRSNPDLDGFLYHYEGGHDAVVVALFDSEEDASKGGLAAARVSLVDLSTGRVALAPPGTQEHPNEAHAYRSEEN